MKKIILFVSLFVISWQIGFAQNLDFSGYVQIGRASCRERV